MSNHWIWAGAFLGLSIGGIGWGAMKGVAASRAALHEEVREAEARPQPSNEGKVADPDEGLRRQLRMAIFLGRQGEFEAAEQALLDLVNQHPDRSSLWLNLGVARVGGGKLDAAETAFKKALQLAPEDWDAVAELANVALERGELDAAVRIADRIPAQQGRMEARLARDLRWRKHLGDPRVQALREKHGLDREPDTSEALAAELEARREGTDTGTVAETVTASTAAMAATTATIAAPTLTSTTAAPTTTATAALSASPTTTATTAALAKLAAPTTTSTTSTPVTSTATTAGPVKTSGPVTSTATTSSAPPPR